MRDGWVGRRFGFSARQKHLLLQLRAEADETEQKIIPFLKILFGTPLKTDFLRRRGRRTAEGSSSRIEKIKFLLLIFQNRFEQRSVIATKRNIANFLRKIEARSASLPLGFAFHNSFYNKELNQMAFQNLKRLFCSASDGSEWQSHPQRIFNYLRVKNSLSFNFFHFCRRQMTKQVFKSHALYPDEVGRPKATNNYEVKL